MFSVKVSLVSSLQSSKGRSHFSGDGLNCSGFAAVSVLGNLLTKRRETLLASLPLKNDPTLIQLNQFCWHLAWVLPSLKAACCTERCCFIAGLFGMGPPGLGYIGFDGVRNMCRI